MPRFLAQALTWDSHQHLAPYVETAIAFGKPPCMFIFEDPKWKRWTKWDARIAAAFHMAKSFEINGYPVWIDQSPRVMFETKERKSRSQAELDRWQFKERKRMEKKNAQPKFGVAPYLVPRTVDGGPMPTRAEWVAAQQNGGTWSGEMTLSTGEVVQTAANPEQMRKFREKIRQRRSQRGSARPVD